MPRASRREWEARIEQWKRSGLTGAEFATRFGLKEATLRHWKWSLDRERRKAVQPLAAPRFVELVSPTPSPAGESFELGLADGRRLRIPASFDADSLRRLLAVLDER